MQISRKEIERKYSEIIEIAKKIMNSINDPEHDIAHVLDVVDYTYRIIENLPDNSSVNIDSCIICAYWHDTGRKVKK